LVGRGPGGRLSAPPILPTLRTKCAAGQRSLRAGTSRARPASGCWRKPSVRSVPRVHQEELIMDTKDHEPGIAMLRALQNSAAPPPAPPPPSTPTFDQLTARLQQRAARLSTATAEESERQATFEESERQAKCRQARYRLERDLGQRYSPERVSLKRFEVYHP